MSRIGLYQLAETAAIDDSFVTGGGGSIPFLPVSSATKPATVTTPPIVSPGSATDAGSSASANGSGQTPFIPSTLNNSDPSAIAPAASATPAGKPWYQWFIDNPLITVGGVIVVGWIAYEIFKPKKQSSNG